MSNAVRRKIYLPLKKSECKETSGFGRVEMENKTEVFGQKGPDHALKSTLN